MVTSMTGFGRGLAEQDDFRVTVEMKSVNHRFLEFFIRMPRQLSQIEDKLKKQVAFYIKRGKVDVYITISGEELTSRSLKIDWQLVDSYYDFAKDAKNRYHINQEITLDHLLANSDILAVEENLISSNEAIETLINSALKQAAEKLHLMRQNEGLELEKDLIHHLQLLEHVLAQVHVLSPSVVTKYRERLEKRIKDFAEGQIDESRLLTEVAIFAEKADVTEEVTRLKSHLGQFESTLKKDEPVGRRLDFLTQEMNREVNTIGSKANDAKLVSYVVEMKSILEKIREQVQNIE